LTATCGQANKTNEGYGEILFVKFHLLNFRSRFKNEDPKMHHPVYFLYFLKFFEKNLKKS